MKQTEVTADGHKKTRRTRRIAVVSAAALAVAIGGGVAYGYWTQGGSGTGSATTGSTTAITVKQTSTVSALAPGLPAQTLSGNFDNPNSGPVYVTSVTASISGVTKAVGAPAGTCDATDYTLAGATMTVGAQVPAGNAQGSWSGATLAFNNKATNQDPCKGATVTLAYSSN